MPSLGAILRVELKKLAAMANRRLIGRLTRMQRQARDLRRANKEVRRAILRLERRVDRVSPRRGRPPAAAPAGKAPSPQQIRAARARLGMTREKFAQHVGVSPGSIFLWETGRATPRAGSLLRLRKVAGGRKARVKGARTRARRARRTSGRPRRSTP
jgi:ribosome-binding protein aMBF1 (putative translation factor)